MYVHYPVLRKGIVQDCFRKFARYSNTILSMVWDRIVDCVVYLQLGEYIRQLPEDMGLIGTTIPVLMSLMSLENAWMIGTIMNGERNRRKWVVAGKMRFGRDGLK